MSIHGISLDNQYLVGLFGTTLLRPSLTLPLLVQQFGLIVALGFVAFILPVRLALKITPRQAMATGT
jgi:hypothetical protein